VKLPIDLILSVWVFYLSDFLTELQGIEIGLRIVGHFLMILASVKVLIDITKKKDDK